MKLQFATSSESLDGRVSILDGGRWNLKFLNICVKHYLWLDIRNKELNIRALCSARVFVHDFNILTPGEAAHRVPGPVRPGLAIISPRSDVSSDVSPRRRVLGHGHTDIGDIES